MKALPALLLSAGSGKRLMPLTHYSPKPLVKVGGKPLIFWHLEALQAAGAERVVINVPEGDGRIEERVGDGSAWSLQVVWCRQDRALDTGGDIKRALPLLGDGAFALINADIHTDYPRRQLIAPAQAPDGDGRLAHMVLAPPPPAHRGDCQLRDALVDPDTSDPDCLWTYSGMSVLHPALFATTGAGSFPLWKGCLQQAAAAGRVSGEIWRGHWYDSGTHAQLAHLRNLLDRHTRSARGARSTQATRGSGKGGG